MKQEIIAAALLLGVHSPAGADAPAKPAAVLAPSEIVAAAPKADWVGIAASDLLVMDLAPDAKGKARRVVIQLMPASFSQGWVGNIRKLATAHWWDGLSVNRVQDNYVVQWGDADGEDKLKARALPKGLAVVQEAAYRTPYSAAMFGSRWSFGGRVEARLEMTPTTVPDPSWTGFGDPYAKSFAFSGGFPVAMTLRADIERTFDERTRTYYGKYLDVPAEVWPTHCYGMVGVGRDMPPNTGTGAELYTVIGHAPRHLDRNIALVGRVIEGIENLSSLPRGTGALGFYETPGERTPIVSVRLGNEVAGLVAYEYLSTESLSFAKYADARANRRDPFFIRPAGGADVCNIPVPVRRVK